MYFCTSGVELSGGLVHYYWSQDDYRSYTFVSRGRLPLLMCMFTVYYNGRFLRVYVVFDVGSKYIFVYVVSVDVLLMVMFM